jgi:hypothetical protein
MSVLPLVFLIQPLVAMLGLGSGVPPASPPTSTSCCILLGIPTSSRR